MEERKNEKKAIFGGKRPAGERGLTKSSNCSHRNTLLT